MLLIYGRALTHSFTNYDDPVYLTHNPHIVHGLTTEGFRWAWTGSVLGMWHPLTVLVHMLDWQLFGAWAGGHIGVNVLLHAVNAGLLWHVLRRMTGAGWPAFFTALLFAVHPLNVESVAWASQLKTVLSTLFGLLTLLTWEKYVTEKSRTNYLLALVWCALGLLSKPMLVTLPVVLLLCDFWPLQRPLHGVRDGLGLLLEKAPFALMAAMVCYILLHPGVPIPGVDSPEPGFTLARWLRGIGNTVVYLRRLVWPFDLAALHPQRIHVQWPELTTALAVLTALTGLAWRGGRAPSVGWLWFLITLFPVCGIMAIGPHEQADRYAYLPAIGIFIFAAWSVPARAWQRPLAPRLAAGLCVCFGLLAWWQVGFWRDSLALWTRATAVHPPSLTQQMNYGNALAAAGRFREAEACFEVVVQLRPNDPRAFINLATIRNQRGETAAAIGLLEQAVRVDPLYANAHDVLGSILQDAGRIAEAREQLETAVKLDPGLFSAHLNLGILLARQGDLTGAQRLFEAALAIEPDSAIARQDLRLVRAQIAGRAAKSP
ncbi:MAG: tetratricopeptide repeat protein [Lacunisphaera sp.]